MSTTFTCNVYGGRSCTGVCCGRAGMSFLNEVFDSVAPDEVLLCLLQRVDPQQPEHSSQLGGLIIHMSGCNCTVLSVECCSSQGGVDRHSGWLLCKLLHCACAACCPASCECTQMGAALGLPTCQSVCCSAVLPSNIAMVFDNADCQTRTAAAEVSLGRHSQPPHDKTGRNACWSLFA